MINDIVQLPLRPGTWRIDHQHSTVGFAIRHLGVSKVRGRFDRFDAQLDVGERLDDCRLSAQVDLASINTGQADRDAQVRSAQMLDVERRPTMTFTSSSIAGVGQDWTVVGILAIGGATTSFQLQVELGGVAPFGDGPIHAGFDARGTLRRRDLDLRFTLPGADRLLGDVVEVQLDVQLVEPGDGAR